MNFTDYLSHLAEEESKIITPEPKKLILPQAKKVESFPNSPIRGVSHDKVREHISGLLDADSGQGIIQKRSNRALLNQKVNLNMIRKLMDQNSYKSNNAESMIDDFWVGQDAKRKALRKAPTPIHMIPKRFTGMERDGMIKDRLEYEAERKQWYRDYFHSTDDNHNPTARNFRLGDGEYGQRISKQLIYKLFDMGYDPYDDDKDYFDYHSDPMDNPFWFNYAQNGYGVINQYLRRGKVSSSGGGIISDLTGGSYEPPYVPGKKSEESKNLGLTDNPEMTNPLIQWVIENLYEDMEDGTRKPPSEYFRSLGSVPNVFEGLNPGDTISDPAFMSTSSDRDFVDHKQGENTIMNIFGNGLKRDFDFENTPHAWDESETVFAPNTPLVYRGRDNESGHYNFDIQGYDRSMNESTQSNQTYSNDKVMSDALKAKMADFTYEIIQRAEKQEEKPEPKQFRDVLKKMVDIDD